MNTTAIRAGVPPRITLRRLLLADGILCGAFGILLALGAGPLSDLLGMPNPLLRVVGLGLLPWAGCLILLATRATIRRGLAWGVIGVNLLWALASVVLLLSGWVDPTTPGIAFTLAQAALVVVIADLQFMALRRSDQ
jgi:hypothetical protein